jgi:hypothetical protein
LIVSAPVVPGNDTISGGNGNDGLVGGDFSGEEGNPGSKVPDGNDVLDGGNGNDFATGMLGTDTVTGGTGNDELFGGPGNDQVSGDNGDDFVQGNFGSDTLSGGNGDDLLNGDNDRGAGPELDPNANSDSCSGGNGSNTFFFCEITSQADISLRGPAGHAAPSGSKRLEEDGRVAGAPVRIEGVVGDHADLRPPEAGVQTRGVAAGHRVQHAESLACGAGFRLGLLHEQLRNAASAC